MTNTQIFQLQFHTGFIPLETTVLKFTKWVVLGPKPLVNPSRVKRWEPVAQGLLVLCCYRTAECSLTTQRLVAFYNLQRCLWFVLNTWFNGLQIKRPESPREGTTGNKLLILSSFASVDPFVFFCRVGSFINSRIWAVTLQNGCQARALRLPGGPLYPRHSSLVAIL